MKVFLDMDGVLVNFRRGICEAFDRDDPSTNWTFWENWEGVTVDDVNDRCNTVFWELLYCTSEGMEIEQAVRHTFGEDNIYILTTPMPNPGSSTGKLLWIKQHVPWLYDRTIISYAPKSLLAGPGTLLIDDKDKNIEEFRAAGGQGILVPRSWNQLRGVSCVTLDYIKQCLGEF